MSENVRGPIKCSCTRVDKCRGVSPTYQALEPSLVGAKNILKHYVLNIAYCLWILYDLGFAI